MMRVLIFALSMKWTNYHHHSQYDDGRESIEQHVITAIDLGVKSLGFSGHCPVPYRNRWAMKYMELEKYFTDIEDARIKFQDQIELYKSLEIDYIPGIIGPADPWIKKFKLDYTIGSVHFAGKYEDGSPGEVDGRHDKFLDCLEHVYDSDIKAFVRHYFSLTRKMVNESPPDIIGHLDKIKMQNRQLWDESSTWYRNEILKTLEDIKAAGLIVEVNTRGLYKKKTVETYPGKWALGQIQKMNIPIHINSDAHIPKEVTSKFTETLELLYYLGFRHVKILHQKQWILAKIINNELIW